MPPCASPNGRHDGLSLAATVEIRDGRFRVRDRSGPLDTAVRVRHASRAEDVLKSLFIRLPLGPVRLFAEGRKAMAREDWDAAIAIWRRYRLIYFWDAKGWDQLGRSVVGKRLAVEADATDRPARPEPVKVARVRDEATCQLLLGFESVGDDCEFGMLQRRYGAEPISLLRWNYVPFANLLAALDAGFAGMGEPEHTELWYAGDGSETFIADKRWGLHIHTFMSKAEVDEASFYPKACRRVAFLRDKFLADLAAGEKVIVFKSAHIGIGEMQALHAAFQRFGRVRVLCVAPVSAEPPSPMPYGEAGRVFALSDGLYVGFIRRFGNVGGGRWDIVFDDWIAVCRAIETAPPWPGPGRT